MSLTSLISWLTSIMLMFTFLSMVDVLSVPLVMYTIMTYTVVLYLLFYSYLKQVTNHWKNETLFVRCIRFDLV